MGKFIDLTGQLFGRLLVEGRRDNIGGDATWMCKCNCGTRLIVRARSLKSGNTQSCGCYSKEVRKTATVTHGQARKGAVTKEHMTWQKMIARCHNASDGSFYLYGGRGILVCERWRGSFEAFFADMGPAPTSRHSIDRIDNDGGYEPSNCRWATPAEQAVNKRNNVRLSDGSLARDVRVVSGSVFCKRIKGGMSVDEAAITPRRHARILMPDGTNAWDVAKAHGVNHAALLGRMRIGWDVVRAATTPIRGTVR